MSQEGIITAADLPIQFQAKYLGHKPTLGLWGIKHTRKPVNQMVEEAKSLPNGKILPSVQIQVSGDGLCFKEIKSKNELVNFKVDSISYGVQDLIYTRVFCIIEVKDVVGENAPFVCHAFVCESKAQAQKLTYALAAAFQSFAQRVQKDGAKLPDLSNKRFAIDLRSPEELLSDMDIESDV